MRSGCNSELASGRGVSTRFGDLARDVDAMCIDEPGATAEVDTAALVMDRLSGTHVVPPASALV